MFYRSLGKDAEGIAVLALIELILKYDGADFANWPGLARCKVHFALFDAMQKQGQIWENEAQVDTESAAGTELLEACRDADGSLDELARLLLSLDLQEALRQLNPAQRQVLSPICCCINWSRRHGNLLKAVDGDAKKHTAARPA